MGTPLYDRKPAVIAIHYRIPIEGEQMEVTLTLLIENILSRAFLASQASRLNPVGNNWVKFSVSKRRDYIR